MAIYRGTGSASSTSDQATIDEVTTQATNAANSATSAASSATSASSSASSASSSATSAATSATTATNKASEASASASAASDSAGLASTSETNASDSETAASLSASQAAASATNASGSQTAAETAQAAAETAQTAAETAQTAAETAESNVSSTISSAVAVATADAEAAQTAAETAATNSATSATNAANSATASANSATASATSATAAQTAQTNAETAETNAEAALDEFTDLYLGVKSSAPTLDNDGDALQTGALYYDSTAEQLYIWEGSAWDQAAFSVSGAVTSFNTRTGVVTLSSGDVTTALGYTPSQASDITTAVNNLVDSAPGALDTLNELAAALGDDANFSTTVTNSLATKAPLASPALTGTPTAPTATANTNTTQLATTAYVQGELANETNWNTAYGWGDHGVEGYLTGNQTITLSGDVSGSGTTSIAVTVADDSHNHVISNVDGLQSALDAKQASGSYAVTTNNLSDLSSASTARSNLGLGSLATLSTVNAATITDNSVGAAELNVSGNGTTAQFLRSDGDGTFTWATPTDTNTTYSADGNYGMTLSGTAFRLENDRRRNATGEDIWSGNTHDYTFYDASVGIRWYTAGAEEMRLENDGDLHVDADVIAYSTTVSDRRLKTNIAGINNALAKVSKLNGYTFEYIKDGKISAGVIAQEVEAVLPEAVSEKKLPFKADDDKEYKVVNYDALHGLLIEAIKELAERVEALEAK